MFLFFCINCGERRCSLELFLLPFASTTVSVAAVSSSFSLFFYTNYGKRRCSLESLDLRFCGRGFGDIAAAQVAKSGPLRKLLRLRLAGAYRLTPESLLKVLVATPEVTQLLLPHCVRLQGPELQQLPRLLPQLVELDLTACGGLDGAALAAGLSGLSNLQRLTLSALRVTLSPCR